MLDDGMLDVSGEAAGALTPAAAERAVKDDLSVNRQRPARSKYRNPIGEKTRCGLQGNPIQDGVRVNPTIDQASAGIRSSLNALA